MTKRITELQQDSFTGREHDIFYRAVKARDADLDGRIFMGVRTTRIYCRPVCASCTPGPQSVIFYPTAAAAQEAGFAPCLQCRPEIAPDLGVWRGTSRVVSRALLLIEMGALDNSNVDALARQVGTDQRRLECLFREQLGASPVAVAQTRRTLLAKQLIHETPLSMTQIAEAAGFKSTRLFSDTFLALLGKRPSALRKSFGCDRTDSDDDAVSFLLYYRPPYDWPAMLGFLRTRAIAGVESIENNVYRRTIEFDGQWGTLSVRPSATNALRIFISFPQLSVLPKIIARLRRLFDLAIDPGSIADQLRMDPILEQLIADRPGLRLPGAWDGFELAVRAILGQQITVPAAIRLAGKLVASYGKALQRSDGTLTHLFPEPGAIANADLAALGMPRSRAKALSAMAAAVVENPGIFSPGRDLKEVVGQLRSLPGIGEWTAQYIAMRQFREADAFPAADIGLMRAMTDSDGVRPSAAELLTRAERWRPWRAYAAQYLWTRS